MIFEQLIRTGADFKSSPTLRQCTAIRIGRTMEQRSTFGSNREGGGKINIFVMNADGSNVAQLTHFPAGQEAGDVGWSPDDKQMVFEWDIDGHAQADPNAHAEIWMMNADGTNAHTTGVRCSGVGCGPRWQRVQ